MRIRRTLTLRIAVLLSLALVPLARSQAAKSGESAADSKPFRIDRFQASIDAFVAADALAPPKPQGILFIGSSIFRQWTSLTSDFAPLPVFNRAFGGSRTIEVLHYADTLVLPYRPRLIVYYCGSNDINADVRPQQILANFQAFAAKVHQALPGTRIVYASILRAPQKKDRWDWVDEANRLISLYCSREAFLAFVDINPAVINPDGSPRMELYKADKLHYLSPAYVGFTGILKPVVTRLWAEPAG